MNISSLKSVLGPAISPETKVVPPDAQEGSSLNFADLLRQVAATESTAQQAVDTYAVGASQNLHETMIALEKADISLSLLVNVRNKFLDAYREVMRMS